MDALMGEIIAGLLFAVLVIDPPWGDDELLAWAAAIPRPPSDAEDQLRLFGASR